MYLGFIQLLITKLGRQKEITFIRHRIVTCIVPIGIHTYSGVYCIYLNHVICHNPMRRQTLHEEDHWDFKFLLMRQVARFSCYAAIRCSCSCISPETKGQVLVFWYPFFLYCVCPFLPHRSIAMHNGKPNTCLSLEMADDTE